MTSSPVPDRELPLLLHTPTGRDAALLQPLLQRAGMSCVICATIDELCREMERNVGAVLIAEEALHLAAVEKISEVLEKQGTWSEVPLLVFTGGGEPTVAIQQRLSRLEPLGGLTLLERPLRSATIISAARTALRARAKQYDVLRRDAELQMVTDNVPVLISYIDKDQIYRRVNRTYVDWFGLPLDQIVGRSIREVAGERHYAIALPYVARTLQGERVWFESQMLCCDHLVRDVTVSYAPEVGADGTVRGFVALVQDVTDRMQQEKELRRSNEELQRVNRELEEFAYAASHDLQEPLRTVSSYSQLLVRRYGNQLGPDAKELLDFIVSGVKRMSALITDLLDYSQVTQSELTELAEVDTRAVVQEAIASLQTAVHESGARVTCDDLPQVAGDASLLVQLFQNLIGNAIKYRRDDPPYIRVSAEPKGQEWLFAVKDNGLGFAPEYAERIFGLFKRLHGRDLPGTGIGLALCRRIVERHGGRIWAESEPGRGSTFYFTLPRAA